MTLLRPLVHWFARAGRQSRAEVLAAAAGVVGWFGITVTISAHAGWTVWPASIGVLLLAGPGIRTVLRVLWEGIYEAPADDEPGRR